MTEARQRERLLFEELVELPAERLVAGAGGGEVGVAIGAAPLPRLVEQLPEALPAGIGHGRGV